MDENKADKDVSGFSKIEKNRKSKRGRKKGITKPLNSGRKKGSLNKKTVFMTQILEQAGFDFGTELMKALKEASVSEKLAILRELFPYVAPRLNPKDVQEPQPEPTQDTSDILKLVTNDK